MKWRYLLITVLLVLLVAGASRAALGIENVQSCYGKFGPVRENLTLSTLDEITFCFDIVGIKTDAEGKVEGVIRVQVNNTQGKVILENESPIKGKLALGGNRLPGNASLSFEKSVPAGEYAVTVTIMDTLGDEKAMFQRKVRFQAEKLALVSPQFFRDADGKLPAPLRGVVGETLHFRLKAVNFEKSTGKVDAVLTVQTYDAEGRELMPKPLITPIRADDPEMVKQAMHLSFKGLFVLNRAGEFHLKMTVTDNLSSASDSVTLPLSVAPVAGDKAPRKP